MSDLTRQELYAAGAACCLAACEYGQPVDTAGWDTLKRMRATALQLLTIPGGIEPTELKDLGMRLLEMARASDE